ncbi:MAG: methyltransferase domain-containing protein [Cyanobacteria bacterium P01_E01_bin.42]
MADRVTEHYRNLSNNYDELWSYSPEFITAMAQAICDRLQAKTSDRIVDLGGGTGLYTKAIDRLLQPDRKIICVDPSREMLDCVNSERIETRCQDAVIFTEELGEYNKVVMKEAIHHIPEKERLFANLYRQLPTGGIFLLLLLPPTIEYPLFTTALQRYEKGQPNYRDLEEQLKNAGFQIATDLVDFPVAIDRDRYLNMVKMRYMSLFRHFTDEEIARGIEEIKEKYPDTILKFNDRFVFITASK